MKCDCRECLTKFRRALAWLDETPGGISTLIVLAGFVIGMWSLLAIWSLGKCIRP